MEYQNKNNQYRNKMSVKYTTPSFKSQENSLLKPDQTNKNTPSYFCKRSTTIQSQLADCSFKPHSIFNPILTSTFYKKKYAQMSRISNQKKRSQMSQSRRLKQLRQQEEISILKNRSRMIKAETEKNKQSKQQWQNFYKWSHIQNLDPLFQFINFSRTKFRKQTRSLIKHQKNKCLQTIGLNGQSLFHEQNF